MGVVPIWGSLFSIRKAVAECALAAGGSPRYPLPYIAPCREVGDDRLDAGHKHLEAGRPVPFTTQMLGEHQFSHAEVHDAGFGDYIALDQ